MAIGQKVARYGDLPTFQNGGHPPSWICFVHVWTTHDENFVIFITVQIWLESMH